MNERLSVGKDLEQLADLDIQSRSQSDGALELELAQTKVIFNCYISPLTIRNYLLNLLNVLYRF